MNTEPYRLSRECAEVTVKSPDAVLAGCLVLPNSQYGPHGNNLTEYPISAYGDNQSDQAP